MTEGTIKLFRQEVADNRRDTWLGEIILTRPISYTMMMWLFLTMAALTIVYVAIGEYTKKARASGYIVPDQGLLKVYPQVPGFITILNVKEGDVVTEGQVLAVVTTEHTGIKGNTQAEMAKEIEKRRLSLNEQRNKTHLMYADQIESTRKRLSKLQKEHQEITTAVAGLRQRVVNAETVVTRYKELEREHFVAELALNEKQSDLLDQQIRLNDMVFRLSSGERDITILQSDLVTLPIKEKNDTETIARAIFDLNTTGLDNESRRESYVIAPHSGMVTQIQADKGRQVSPALPIMNLILAGSKLLASLYVPSRSIGFIRVGSIAGMQYQAFQYQKFGTHEGKVIGISRTAVPAQELPFPVPPTNEVFYVVTVQPTDNYVLAYGKKEPLQAGMQLDADIWLERRTVIEWVLEPIYSITGRI